MAEHTEITAGEIHSPFQWVVANATARGSITAEGAHDLHKLCLQLDTLQVYRMSVTSPVTWSLVADAPGSGLSNPMTTAEDLIVGGASGSPARLAVGTNDHVLTVIAGSIAWAAATGGFANPMTAAQDLIVGGASGVAARIAAGTEGQVLTISSGVVAWAAASSGFANPMTTAGDVIVGGTGGAAARLGLGTTGQVLSSNGTAATWTTPTVGTVTSVVGTGTVNGITLTGTVTAAGDLTLGGTLSGVSLATQVSGTLPIANGGTGQTTASTAINALVPDQATHGGKVLGTNGTAVSWVADAGFANPMTTQGDIITGGASGAPQRLAKGTSGHFLKAGASDPAYAAITAADISDASANSRAVLTAADYAAIRTLLGLVIGTNVQAYDADTAKLDVAQTWTALQTLLGLRETVQTITGTTPALSIAGGRIGTWTLSGASTPTHTGMASGDALSLAVTHGAHAIAWTNFTVVGDDIAAGGGVTFYETWKIGTVAYVAKVGSTA